MGTTIRLVLLTLLGCAVIHPLLVLAIGRALAPEAAEGSLVRDGQGRVVGSRLVAQQFERDDYLWPRPSAAGYDAMAAAGSNLASSNPELRVRAVRALERMGAATSASEAASGSAASGVRGPAVPAELVTASGSGLDPHVTLAGALHQAPRIAAARHVAVARVEEVVRAQVSEPGLVRLALVNVLEANLALDRELGRAPASASDGEAPH
jgi:K+-transporting ATPase ATPase C chain